MYCKNCGAELADTAVGCSECGAAKGAGFGFCPHCGQSVPMGASACMGCGAAVFPESIMQAPMPVGYAFKSRIVAGLLGIFLGFLGVHNFYLGHKSKAIVQLLLTVLSCFALSIASWIWGIVDAVMILNGSAKTDAKGMPLKG